MNLWHDVRLLNAIANGLMAVAVTALVASVGAWVVQRPAFALQAVVVEPSSPEQPLQHVNRALLRSAGAARLHGNFFTVDLGAVREAFEQVPWVRQAQVRRIWPNTLRVGIEEHEPLAVWHDGRLVNTFGELFAANAAEAEADRALLEFSGPPGSEAEVLRRWQELRTQLAPLSLTPEALTLSSRYAWSARLENGTVLLLGRDQGLPIAERVARWVAVYPTVQTRLNREIAQVDLRYPNGFAMRAPGALDKAPPDKGGPRAAAAVRPTQAGPVAAHDRSSPSKRSQ
ncbi:MAG: cell division protein FtsQ/DivIB [Burkholderiaceae bacterium]|jgi:cell division protein FtsQ